MLTIHSCPPLLIWLKSINARLYTIHYKINIDRAMPLPLSLAWTSWSLANNHRCGIVNKIRTCWSRAMGTTVSNSQCRANYPGEKSEASWNPYNSSEGSSSFVYFSKKIEHVVTWRHSTPDSGDLLGVCPVLWWHLSHANELSGTFGWRH